MERRYPIDSVLIGAVVAQLASELKPGDDVLLVGPHPEGCASALVSHGYRVAEEQLPSELLDVARCYAETASGLMLAMEAEDPMKAVSGVRDGMRTASQELERLVKPIAKRTFRAALCLGAVGEIESRTGLYGLGRILGHLVTPGGVLLASFSPEPALVGRLVAQSGWTASAPPVSEEEVTDPHGLASSEEHTWEREHVSAAFAYGGFRYRRTVLFRAGRRQRVHLSGVELEVMELPMEGSGKQPSWRSLYIGARGRRMF